MTRLGGPSCVENGPSLACGSSFDKAQDEGFFRGQDRNFALSLS
jgi:hypothetical protein